MSYNNLPFLITSDEYNLDFLYGIYESKHSVNTLHICSEEICSMIHKLIDDILNDMKNDMSQLEIIKKYILNKKYYSGFEYIGYIIDNNKISKDSNYIFNSFYKISEMESEHHKIYFAFFMNDDRNISQINYRNIKDILNRKYFKDVLEHKILRDDIVL